jgi:hypothetical protein
MTSLFLFQQYRWQVLPSLLVLASIFTDTRAADYEVKRGPATLRITGVRLDSERLLARLSDRLSLTIQVEGPPGMEVEPIAGITASTAWEVEPEMDALEDKQAADRMIWRESFALRPVRPGVLYLPLQSLRYREAAGQPWQVVKWPAIIIHVSTDILTPDASELYDRLEPEEPPYVPAWWEPIFRPAIGAVLACSLVAALLLLARRRAPVPPPEPDVLAELDRIAYLPVESAEQIENYHKQLADVIHTFLHQTLDISVTKQTTAELLSQIDESCPWKEQIAQVLESCDLVKFARAMPDPEDCHALVSTVRMLMAQLTKPDGNASFAVAQKRQRQQENGPVS